MTTRTASPLMDGLVAFLLADGWPVDLATGTVPTVRTRCAGTTAEWACTGRSFEQQGQVVFDSELPMVVPEDQRPGIALLLARANWSLHTGAFALEPDTGEMRLRTSLVRTRTEGEEGVAAPLPEPAAKALVYANVLIVDRCMPTLEAAVAGSISATDALRQLAL